MWCGLDIVYLLLPQDKLAEEAVKRQEEQEKKRYLNLSDREKVFIISLNARTRMKVTLVYKVKGKPNPKEGDMSRCSMYRTGLDANSEPLAPGQ